MGAQQAGERENIFLPQFHFSFKHPTLLSTYTGNLMKVLSSIVCHLIAVIVFSSLLYAQKDEAEAYKNTFGISDPQKRIEALKEFVAQYPSGKFLTRAYSDLFRLHAAKADTNDALNYAELYINTYPEASRMNAYNSAAYTLAENKIGLKSAAVYAQKAVDLAQNASVGKLRQILDTKALVLFELGYPDSALTLEREAIRGNEEDPSYLYFLAVYEEANGLREDALFHAAQAILYGDAENAPARFDDWLKKEKSTAEEQKILKEKIVNNVVEEYVKESGGTFLAMKNSTAAAFMAAMQVDVKRAKEMALSALTVLGENIPLDDLIAVKTNLAVVYAALGENAKAFDALQSVKKFVPPYAGEYWYTMGQLYEKQKDIQNALDSYVQGLTAYPNAKIQSAAGSLIGKNNLDSKLLDEKIEAAKVSIRNFHPDKRTEKNTTGRRVLAELFTGAECGPCVAADQAFDLLSEHYPRTDLVILEYHVHIPGPDPLTNPDSYKRYSYYGGDFGTPTVFVDGGGKLTGGGNDLVTANRFRVYDHLISKRMHNKPDAVISGKAVRDSGDVVNITLELQPSTILDINSKGADTQHLTLLIALVEKSVSYTGANGVSKHLFVVRDMVDKTEGKIVKRNKRSATYSVSVNLNEVRKRISVYLDDPTKDESWRGGSFGGWRERTDMIDSSNLAIVAWVQNTLTNEVVQSFYVDVVSDISAK